MPAPMKKANDIYLMIVIVLLLAVLWTLPLGIIVIEEGADAFHWRHIPGIFPSTLEIFGVNLAAFLWQWIALIALWMLQRRPRWIFYSVLAVAAVIGSSLAVLVVGIQTMEHTNLGP